MMLKLHEVICQPQRNKYTTFVGKSNRCLHLLHLNWILLAVPAFPQFQHLVKLISVVWKYLLLCCLLHFIVFGLDIVRMVNFWIQIVLRLCNMFLFSLDFFSLRVLIKSENHININTLFIKQLSFIKQLKLWEILTMSNTCPITFYFWLFYISDRMSIIVTKTNVKKKHFDDFICHCFYKHYVEYKCLSWRPIHKVHFRDFSPIWAERTHFWKKLTSWLSLIDFELNA